MTDINTTLRGNQTKEEDPKSPGTIAKKIFQGLFAIVLAVAIWTLSFLAITRYCRDCKLYV